MGSSHGRRRWRWTVREVDASQEAMYLKALASLRTAHFTPDVRTASELVATGPAAKSAGPLQAAS